MATDSSMSNDSSSNLEGFLSYLETDDRYSTIKIYLPLPEVSIFRRNTEVEYLSQHWDDDFHGRTLEAFIEKLKTPMTDTMGSECNYYSKSFDILQSGGMVSQWMDNAFSKDLSAESTVTDEEKWNMILKAYNSQVREIPEIDMDEIRKYLHLSLQKLITKLSKRVDGLPMILVAFDEAANLYPDGLKLKKQQMYLAHNAINRILRSIIHQSLWVVYMSTQTRIDLIITRQNENSSARVQYGPYSVSLRS
ncbi:hypothetical protein BDD12DRAFT_892981 [Trichophaea hybrida]|nr:hypothetical protein BDD12DRAFT_892981 [Trichophaea hybrida]